MNARWAFSVIASVALHVIILVILVGWHLSSEKTEGPNAPAMETPPASEEVVSKEPERPTEVKRSTESKRPSAVKPAEAPMSMLSSEDEIVESKPVSKPKASTKAVEVKEVKPVAKSEKPAKGHQMTTYVVKKGDSLTSIAKECGCTPAELAKLNGKTYKAFSKLWVGQKIKIKAKEE